MSVILSCGHHEDNFDNRYSIMTKEWSKENRKAIGYKTVCLYCYEHRDLYNELLYTDKEAMEWVNL